MAIGIVGFFAVGAGSAARATLVRPGTVVPAGDVAGFGQVAFMVSAGPGLPAPTRASCALLASTPAQRNRGLMGRRSLGRYVGMLFEFPGPTTDVFYTYATPLPLSIAWFDAGGRLIGERNLPPCHSHNAAACPRYRAPQAFSLALEVPETHLPGLGIGAGSSISASGPCIG